VTSLADRIRDIAMMSGPMSVSAYMATCLHDPKQGYYATRPGLGRDFTTAPEISQVFGELLGLWAAHEWRAMGSPETFQLVELGPGRGTLMADALRAAAAVPGFREAARIVLVEISPALREEQRLRLNDWRVLHVDDFASVPAGPAIVLANEFLDCLPIRQFKRDGNGWRERRVGVDKAGALIFGLSPEVDLPGGLLPAADIVEIAPALDSLVDALAVRFAAAPGRALFVDYGPADASPADTLRAYRAGRQVDPLDGPGESDLTADVDFLRLRHLAEAAGLAVFGPEPQGRFLTRLGVQSRSRTLCEANPARADEISAGVLRLVSPDEMGLRFKAICLAPRETSPPPGF
jgi:NADH dehydrogenase [ubiquinone] 1 alpha subcomplex assembly factor 7